jgi:hypothetical protein
LVKLSTLPAARHLFGPEDAEAHRPQIVGEARRPAAPRADHDQLDEFLRQKSIVRGDSAGLSSRLRMLGDPGFPGAAEELAEPSAIAPASRPAHARAQPEPIQQEHS